MNKFIILLLQFIILLILTTLAIKYSWPVSLALENIVITTSTSVLIIGVLIVILITIFFQKILFFFQKSALRYKIYKERLTHQKGYNSFLQGMVALVNKDFKRAVQEAKKANKYFKDESLSLLLKSEILKVEKKYEELNSVYEEMLKNTHTNLLGLRGLMEQNLRAQDYHHAFIYGEKLFNLNPRIDQLYETLVNIIGKTNNWQKLLQINEQSFKQKIINKVIYEQNKSISLYEIAKIKQHGSNKEAINLMEKAIKLRESFSPYISFYIQLLININKLEKAKKILNKNWTNLPHPDLKNEIILLANKMKISFYELAKSITYNSTNHPLSRILLTESLIEKQDWENARNQIKTLLEHNPTREVCLLMANIEKGDTGDPQKINSWISRSNYARISKIWVCQISNVTQNEWTSVSQSGYFNSLKWQYPKKLPQLSNSDFEIESVKYINH